MTKSRNQFASDFITKPGLHSTGERNLYLLVASNGRGAKSWAFRYFTHGKTKTVGLGPLHSVSFAEAQRKALTLRQFMLEGKDPAIEWSRLKDAGEAVPTFADVAAEFIKAKSPEWKNEKHIAQWAATLETYAAPIIGRLPVDAIATEHVLRILTPIWSNKTETATRVRQRVESVLDYARAKGHRAGDNPAQLTGHLEHLLPQVPKSRRVKHHPSLPWERLPTFMAALRTHEGQAAKMMELMILTATRSGEVRGAEWNEFDLDAGVWSIPAARMKAGRQHTVPLSPSALLLLRGLTKHSGTNLVFASRKLTPLSDMALSALTRGMNEGESGPVWIDTAGEPIVPHGFRSTFRVWAGECTNTPRDVAEHALAHQLPDRVEAAYQRSTLFEKRVRLMNEWAAWATSTPGAGVLPLRRSEAA